MSELEDIFAGLHAPAKGRGTDAPGRRDASTGSGGAARTQNADGADGAATNKRKRDRDSKNKGKSAQEKADNSHKRANTDDRGGSMRKGADVDEADASVGAGAGAGAGEKRGREEDGTSAKKARTGAGESSRAVPVVVHHSSSSRPQQQQPPPPDDAFGDSRGERACTLTRETHRGRLPHLYRGRAQAAWRRRCVTADRHAPVSV